MKDYRRSYAKQIEYIMANFDFELVKECMDVMDWRWHGHGIPSRKMLKETARYHLQETAKPQHLSSASGGFYAWKDLHYKTLHLAFYISKAGGKDDLDD